MPGRKRVRFTGSTWRCPVAYAVGRCEPSVTRARAASVYPLQGPDRHRVVGSGPTGLQYATHRVESLAPRQQRVPELAPATPERVSPHCDARGGHGHSRPEGIVAIRRLAAPVLRALREPGRTGLETLARRAPDVRVVLRLRVWPVLGKSRRGLPRMRDERRAGRCHANGWVAPWDDGPAAAAPTQSHGGGCRGSRRPALTMAVSSWCRTGAVESAIGTPAVPTEQTAIAGVQLQSSPVPVGAPARCPAPSPRRHRAFRRRPTTSPRHPNRAASRRAAEQPKRPEPRQPRGPWTAVSQYERRRHHPRCIQYQPERPGDIGARPDGLTANADAAATARPSTNRAPLPTQRRRHGPTQHRRRHHARHRHRRRRRCRPDTVPTPPPNTDCRRQRRTAPPDRSTPTPLPTPTPAPTPTPLPTPTPTTVPACAHRAEPRRLDRRAGSGRLDDCGLQRVIQPRCWPEQRRSSSAEPDAGRVSGARHGHLCDAFLTIWL